MTTINKVKARLRRLVCSQHTIVLDDVLHLVYDLMLLNSGDIELLHSTIEHVTQNFSDKKWCGPTIFIQLTVRSQLINVPLLLYLNEHNFQDFGRSTKDFGEGGKVNDYCIYVNHPFTSPAATADADAVLTPTQSLPAQDPTTSSVVPPLDLNASSLSMEWVDPLGSLGFLDCMPSLEDANLPSSLSPPNLPVARTIIKSINPTNSVEIDSIETQNTPLTAQSESESDNESDSSGDDELAIKLFDKD